MPLEPRTIDKAALRVWLSAHQWTQAELARVLNIHLKTVERWAQGVKPPPPYFSYVLDWLHLMHQRHAPVPPVPPNVARQCGYCDFTSKHMSAVRAHLNETHPSDPVRYRFIVEGETVLSV